MLSIEGDMYQIRIRFVQGVLAGMAANDLHSYVTRERRDEQESR